MPRFPVVVISCLIAVTTVATYLPVRHAGFLRWDDQNYVTDNAHVRAGLGRAGVTWAFTTQSPPYWHPLTWLSHMIDVELFGLDAGRHHAVNVLIHTCNALLLFAALGMMTGAVWRSALVAAAFAVHPLHVESVAWIAERKDLLSTFFLFLSLIAYVRYVGRPTLARYALVVATFAAALMSKPMVVTYPFALLLLDFWPLRRRASRQTLLEKVPLIVMALAVAVETVVIQHRAGAVASTTTFPVGLRIANALVSLVAYLRQTVWPAGLAAFYPWNWSVSPLAVGGAGLLVVAISAGSFLARRTRPYLTVGWTWLLLTVLPVVGLIQSGEQSRGDRFMYLPLVGLALAIVWGLESLVSREGTRMAAACASVVALTGFAAASYRQAEYWQTDVTLWERAVAVTPGNYLAHDLLGLAYENRGDSAKALEEYATALRLATVREPDFAGLVENNIGAALLRQSKAAEARAHFAAAARLNPASPEIRYDYGASLVAAGEYQAAAAEFRAALAARHPRPADVQSDLGLALLGAGRTDEALHVFTEAAQIDPSNANAENGIGACLSTHGQDGEAVRHYRAAIRLKPDFALAHENLAMALVRLHRPGEGLDALLEAVRLDPNQPVWEFNAAVLLAQSGRAEAARVHYQRVVVLWPESELAQRALATIR
jgi:tetratricopeptide (TPR) repeat protein